jgi:hypothetical protein
MDEHRNVAMREDLDRLVAEDDRRDAVAAVRGRDDGSQPPDARRGLSK